MGPNLLPFGGEGVLSVAREASLGILDILADGGFCLAIARRGERAVAFGET